jgi:hypothetical protein
VVITDGGLVATKTAADSQYDLVTSGKEVTEGRHYWEVELMSAYFRVGIASGVTTDVKCAVKHIRKHALSSDANAGADAAADLDGDECQRSHCNSAKRLDEARCLSNQFKKKVAVGGVVARSLSTQPFCVVLKSAWS